MTKAHAHLAFLAFSLTLSMTGCNSSHDEPANVERWGGQLSDLRVQWDATPGIDLTAGAAVPVRAYLESRFLVENLGSLDYAYPGFSEAVPPNEPQESSDVAGQDRRPSTSGATSPSLVGTSRYFLRSVEESADSTIATLCNYTYAVAEKLSDGKIVPYVGFGNVDTRGIVGMRVILSAASGGASAKLPPQEGPAPAPSSDVFAGWKVTGFLAAAGSYAELQWPSYAADFAACVDNAPDPLDRRTFLVTEAHSQADFPTSPPSPGWPEAPTQ